MPYTSSERRSRLLGRVAILAASAGLIVLMAASPAFAWGELLVSGRSYDGVSVYSNYPRPIPWDSRGDSGYGTRYQCVELAQRLYAQKGWAPYRRWGISYAYQMFSAAPRMGLQTAGNGRGTLPAWGDIVVFRSNPYSSAGHVAIVTAVGRYRLYVVEQNGSRTGRRELKYYNGTISEPYVIGWVKRPRR